MFVRFVRYRLSKQAAEEWEEVRVVCPDVSVSISGRGLNGGGRREERVPTCLEIQWVQVGLFRLQVIPQHLCWVDIWALTEPFVIIIYTDCNLHLLSFSIVSVHTKQGQ